VADLGRLVVDAHSKRVYRYTRDLLKELKEQDYYTIAISQSPKAILDEFCQNYGFDKVYGRMYEIGPTDRFTGVVIDEHLIQNKANIVKRVFERHNFDQTGTHAVGDTEGDISMLELVDNPICFNPNQAFYDHALRMGWSVVTERKDVIYNIS
jgi:HAD superfamily phosphoserine phosphatase-like hydrolase